jgi:hypothetical protein
MAYAGRILKVEMPTCSRDLFAVFETKSELPRSFWLNATESLVNIALQTIKR